MINVRFHGSCRVWASDGRDLTPSAAKEKALLLLLCDSHGYRRSRRWLEAMLWSDCTPSRASGSLRQALNSLRRRFGQEDILGSDRQSVWLDSSRIVTDLDTPLFGSEDMLEGLDVGDEAFEDWLRERRSRDALPPSTPSICRRPAISLLPPKDRPGIDWIGSRTLGMRVVDDLACLVGGECRDSIIGKGPELTLECHVAADDADRFVSYRFVNSSDGRVLQSGDLHFDRARSSSQSATMLAVTAHRIAVTLAKRTSEVLAADHPSFYAASLLTSARREMMRFSEQSFARADQILCAAQEISPNGLILAHRALNAMIGWIEGDDTDTVEAAERIRAMGTKAIEMAGTNSHTRAIVAIAMLMAPENDGPTKAAELLPLTLDSDSLTARLVRSMLTSWHGEHRQAFSLSRTVIQAASEDDLAPLWHLYHCLISAEAGQVDEAIRAGQLAARSNPSFHAALRQLTVLYAARGDVACASKTLSQLQRIEPDLTADILFCEPDYPVTTMRRAGLLDRGLEVMAG